MTEPVHFVVPVSSDGETQALLCGADDPAPRCTTDEREVTCAACLGAGIRLGLIEPTPFTMDAGTQVPAAPGTGTTADLLAKARRFAREWRAQEGCGAQVLDDLADAILAFDGDTLPRPTPDVAVGLIELMKLAFAWRAQGSITRWSTAPSVALAKGVSAFAEQYPAFVEGHAAGIADAVIDQVRSESGRDVRDDDPLTIARSLLQRWWLSEPPPIGSGALRDHTRSFLELTHPTRPVQNLLRQQLTTARLRNREARDLIHVLSQHASDDHTRERIRTWLEGSSPTPYDRTLDLLRRFVSAWNATETDPRGERVDMDLLRELADAFEAEDGAG